MKANKHKEQDYSNVNNESPPTTTSMETGYEDNSPEAIEMRVYKKRIDNRPEAIQIQDYHDKINGIQKENTTGIPDNIKSGIEKLSGISLDDVKVYYNSPEPAKIGAYAYTEGTNVYISPGQEAYLSHELWHVIQQKQGKTKPTQKRHGKKVDDRISMESEATNQGKRALQQSPKTVETPKDVSVSSQHEVIQMANWDSPSLGDETSKFIDSSQEKKTLILFNNLKYEAEETYAESDSYDGRDEFDYGTRSFQASFLPQKSRALYLDIANWFDMQHGFRATAKKNQDVIFERHHILPRAVIRTFHAQLTSPQIELIKKHFGEGRDQEDSLKILQSLRSNLVLGPANRLDDPKDNLDLFYTHSGELDPISAIYSNVFNLMKTFDKSNDKLEIIINRLKEAETQQPTVRIDASDWVFNEKMKTWEKRYKAK